MTFQLLRWGNAPVPITAAWSEEREHRQPGVVMWRCCGQRLPFITDGYDRPGTGKPLFTILHSDRCRQVLAADACQMCGRRLARRRVVTTTGATLEGRPLVSDGQPMCPSCAAAAFEACPGLRRHHGNGTLRIFEVERMDCRPVPKVLGIATGPGSDERVNALVRQWGRIYSGPDLQLVGGREIGPEHLPHPRPSIRLAGGADAA